MQSTLVWTLTPGERAALRRALAGGAFEERTVPHAELGVKGEGVVATLYRSGKLVVQGAAAEAFAARYLGGRMPAPSRDERERAEELVPADRALVGGDESGKGDYLGPLAVAAVRLEPDDLLALAGGDVADSKRVSDRRVRVLAPALRERFPHAVEALTPAEYNAAHRAVGNVNTILCRMYRKVVEELAEPGLAVLVDRFSSRTQDLEQELSGLGVALTTAPRAERNLAVAAASLLAREAFLDGLDRLSQEVGVDLAKGAGPPAQEAARTFVSIHGAERLGEVAKLHFANTAKLGIPT